MFIFRENHSYLLQESPQKKMNQGRNKSEAHLRTGNSALSLHWRQPNDPNHHTQERYRKMLSIQTKTGRKMLSVWMHLNLDKILVAGLNIFEDYWVTPGIFAFFPNIPYFKKPPYLKVYISAFIHTSTNVEKLPQFQPLQKELCSKKKLEPHGLPSPALNCIEFKLLFLRL